MKKFKVTATRIDEYEISIDENIWNEAALKDWSSVFHQVDCVKDVVKDLSFQILRQGSENFFEGYGHVKTVTSSGMVLSQFKSGFKVVEEDEYCKGILVILKCEDDEHEFEVEEVKG